MDDNEAVNNDNNAPNDNDGNEDPDQVDQARQLREFIANQVNQQVQNELNRIRAQQQAARIAAQNARQPIVLKSLSKWATRGLNLSEAGFSKLHAQEQKYSDDKPKYNLEPEKFEIWRNELIEKVNRIHAVEVFNVLDADDDAKAVLREYTLLTRVDLEEHVEEIWPGIAPTFNSQGQADDFTDRQIKSSVVGAYIHNSLSDHAKKQLRAQRESFTVVDTNGNEYFDGPSYFYYIAELVDPDNTHMIENVRKQLRTLNVKDFGFSVIKMLAEFKLLIQKIEELGGRYDEEDKFLDFWDCLKTMKEKEFSRYVRQEKDNFRKLNRNQRDNLESYIRDMSRKEVAMKEDNEWNVMSPEDTMIMALVNSLEQKSKSKNLKQKEKVKDKKKFDKKKDNSNESTDDKEKKRDMKIPSWKKEGPKSGESKTKEKDGKTYHWCNKCRGGKGLWALHKVVEHKSDFSYKEQRMKKKGEKQVSFSTDTKSGEDDGPEIKVNKNLISNAKAYLAQHGHTDFQKGGANGH